MELTSGPHPTATAKVVVLICLIWPFIAAGFLSRRGRSAAPIAAVLVPLAVASVGVWLGLENVRRLLAMIGRSGGPIAEAGVAEAISMFYVGGFFALLVIVVAAIRRHRPMLDRVTAVLVVLLIVDVIAALVASMNLATPAPVLIAGAIFSGVVALIAAFRSAGVLAG